jgi:hypothetical protein
MANTTMKIRITQLTVVPNGKPIFDESATQVEITDEGGGEFLVIRQPGVIGRYIRLDADEWPTIREAIERMIDEVKEWGVKP